MNNPYLSPSTNLVETTKKGIGNFERFSAWGVFGLVVVTFGIYYMYWFFSRSNKLNEFYPHKISPIFIWGSVITYLVYLVFSFLVDQLADQPALLIAGVVVSFLYFVLDICWVFAFRNRVLEMARDDGVLDFKVGPIMTFFFQALYFQYKINEYQDKHVA